MLLGKEILNAEPTIDMELLGVFSSDILGHIYEIFMVEKHNSTNKSIFLPKKLVIWNKYITFAA